MEKKSSSGTDFDNSEIACPVKKCQNRTILKEREYGAYQVSVKDHSLSTPGWLQGDLHWRSSSCGVGIRGLTCSNFPASTVTLGLQVCSSYILWGQT